MIDPTKMIRGAVLAFALLFVAPLTGFGGAILGVQAAEAATVSKINVSGNAKVDKATIVSLLTVRVGNNATAGDLAASSAALLSSGLFNSASVTMSGSTVSVKVTENAIVASVLFEGNLRFTDANLVAMVDVMNRGTLDQGGLARDVASIKSAYVAAGYSNVSVTTRQETVGDGRVRLVFVIDEGTRAGIAAINFTGNNSINAWQLKSILKTHETSWLSWLLKDDSYTQEQLDYDRQLIQQYYANHGFPDAQVTSAVAEYNADRGGYFISYTIVEGERYKFGAIGVETSISGLNGDTLTGSIRTHQGDSFSQAEMQRTAEDMAVEATNQGYPFADVRPRVERDPATGVFTVTYLVDEGQRLYVDRINITGNDKTRDYVIRRELPFAEGDPFNRSLLSRGKAKIEALGYFTSVNVSLEAGSAPDKVIVDIAVVEGSSGDYGATLGYGTDGILGTLSLTERNFLGRGQYLKASIGATATGRTFDFSFTEPHFAGLDLSAGIDVYTRINDETDSNLYGKTSTGGDFRFGLPVTRDLSASAFVGLDQTTIADSISPHTTLFCDTTPDCADGLSFTKAWVGYSLNYNTLDNGTHPTEGMIASLTQTYVGVDYNYLKTEAKARYYFPIFMDAGIIGSVKGQVGMINDFSGNGISPLETFNYNQQLVRGLTSIGPSHNGENVGYTAYAAASAEVKFPVPMLPETYGLSGAIWADAAVIDGHGGDFASYDAGSESTDLKSAIGASVIWDSPFGPLRGDFSYVTSKATTDTSQVFTLTLNNLL